MPYSSAQMARIATAFTTASACHTAPGTNILHAYNNAANVRQLCRICGCAGTHSLHEPIPFFVHPNPADVLRWPKTMGAMIADIGGPEYGPISIDQELPQRICTICVTYLMHAIEFREQALNTLLNLKTALRLADVANAKSSGDTGEDLDATKKKTPPPSHDQPTTAAQRIHGTVRQFFASDLACPRVASSEKANGRSPTPNSSDSDTPNGGVSSTTSSSARRQFKDALADFFTHTETHFVEDESAVITEAVAVASERRRQQELDAEPLKERKCYACKRIYMLRTAYEAHQKDCVVAGLLQFTVDCARLVQLWRDTNLLEMEFIRRMVFEVKSLVKRLALQQSGWTGDGGGLEENKKRATAAAVSPSQRSQQPIPWPTKLPIVPTLLLPPALRDEADAGIAAAVPLLLPPVPHLCSPPASSAESGSCEDDASPPEPRFSQSSSSSSSSSMGSHSNATAFGFGKMPKLPTFVANCSECCQQFASIDALELHNRTMHNDYMYSATSTMSDEECTGTEPQQPPTKRQAATMDLLQLLRDNPPSNLVYGAK